MSRRRRAALLFPLVSLTVAVAWAGAGLPPPALLLEFGRWPGARTTGRTRTLSLRLGEPEAQDVEFVEFAPGYVFVDRHTRFCEHPEFGERVARSLGLAWGPAPRHEPRCREWVRLHEPRWIARDAVWSSAPAFDPIDTTQHGDLPTRHSFRDESGEWIRVVSELEFDYACLAGAIHPDPDRPEVGKPSDSNVWPAVLLVPPDRRPEFLFSVQSPPFHTRILWVPND